MAKLLNLSILGLAAVAIVGCNDDKPVAKKAAPPIVTVAQPVEKEIVEHEEFTGRTDAVLTVDVRARVTGYLEKVLFNDGDEVKEGDLLFQIDPRQYEADLARNEATVAQAEAHNKRLEADYQRAVKLLARGGIGREEYDKITGDHNEAEAAVGIAKAARDMAKLNAEWTKVIAPISGRLSRRMVDPGNLVKADDTIMTNIVSQDTMYVYFDIDERTLLRLRRLIREGKIKSRQDAEVPILVELADEAGYPHRGLINFSDNKIDPSTGTLRVRGSIANPKPRVLSPGLFVRVQLPIGTPHRALMVPEQALGTDQGRKFVYVVNDQKKVVYRPVKVGGLEEGYRVVVDGLKTGERVVLNGIQRVKPGIEVNPKPLESAKPEGATVPVAKGASPAPRPASG
ncbi:MAG: efflux RND transporter periplasmic adaptor subunit [Isosphaeraceae bacterium]|nr:efflux RND transporter periplasmic adaptor subunit [Isosphaeraceae bacterium]